MKTKTHAFNADELVRCVEDVRGAVTGRRKITLRTTTLPKPAPAIGPRDVKRLRCRLKMSQPGFAAVLNIPLVTATSWEKGRRLPSGAALRLLEIAKHHPEVLTAA